MRKSGLAVEAGRVIRRLRKHRKLSFYQVAARTGFSAPFLRAVEAATVPLRVWQLTKILTALSADPDAILTQLGQNAKLSHLIIALLKNLAKVMETHGAH